MKMADDPFSFDGSSSSPDECYQAWAAPGLVVANLNPTPYAPVVETVNKEVIKIRRCYPSPREKGQQSFMERMRERNSKQARLKTEIRSNSKTRLGKEFPRHDIKDPFGHLKCSPAMKKFIVTEFEREKVSCNFLPEKQVALAVIHRYKSYIATSASNSKSVSPSPKKTNRFKKSAKLKGKKSKLVRIGKKVPSIGDSGFLEEQSETDNEEIEIQEFDEDDLPLPERGSFSVSPSPAQLKSKKQLLVRYNSDNDTDDISDSSPGKIVNCLPPVKQEVMMRKVAMCGPALPCLTSSSLDQPGDTSVDWAVSDAGARQDLAEEVCGGAACGWCLSCPGPEMLQLCSACSSVAYCGAKCQGASWPTHKKVCKKLKGEAWGLKVELVGQMITMARSRNLKRKLGKSVPGAEDDDNSDGKLDVSSRKRARRTVQFDSQPQFESSQGKEEENAMTTNVTNQPKSILRRGSVNLKTVLYSPPVKTLEQHLVSVREGSQEERFSELKGQTGGSSLKRQTSEKLKNKLSELKNVKLNLAQRLEDVVEAGKPATTTINSPRVFTPSRSMCSSTPVSSPTLVEEIRTMSSTRPSTSKRVLPRRFEQTPYPHVVDLDSDQELSLTPTGSDEKDLHDEVVTRKINFGDLGDSSEDEDDDDDAGIGKKWKEIDSSAEPSSPCSHEDMFASQDAGQGGDVAAGPYVEISSDSKESDNEEVVQASEQVQTITEAVQTAGSEKMVVMVPESSSDSSLAEFSPLDLVLSQDENQDKLTDLFSDAEENGGGEELEDDLLANI